MCIRDRAARVAAAETTRDTAHQETQHALRKVTTGKPCLSGPALRLLNHAAGPAAVPAPAGQPAGADAAFATDTDVAEWAAYARRSYDTCLLYTSVVPGSLQAGIQGGKLVNNLSAAGWFWLIYLVAMGYLLGQAVEWLLP